MAPELAEVFALTFEEKLRLVEALWDNLAATPEELPVHDWQKEELARRKENHLKNPEAACSWEEAKERIRQRHGH